MLGAVVLEDAPQVTHAGEQQEVAEEDRGPHNALRRPEGERGPELVLDEARQRHRDDEEQADREHDGDHHRPGPDSGSDLLGGLPHRRVGGDHQRAHTDRERVAERDDATDDRQPPDPAAALGAASTKL